MSATTDRLNGRTKAVILLSLLLFFFTVPHTLEDFALGEPAKAGISAPLLAFAVAGFFALQGLALFWTGRGSSWGYGLHAAVGVFWAVTAGAAQLPNILAPGAYRYGAISVLYVVGIVIVGVLLALVSLWAWRAAKRDAHAL
jgi:hypothetical protein